MTISELILHLQSLPDQSAQVLITSADFSTASNQSEPLDDIRTDDDGCICLGSTFMMC